MPAIPTVGELQYRAQGVFDCHLLMKDIVDHLVGGDEPLTPEELSMVNTVAEMFDDAAEVKYDLYWKLVEMPREEAIRYMIGNDEFVRSMMQPEEGTHGQG